MVITRSGFSARLVSSYRPSVPVVAVTTRPETCRQLAPVWGVRAEDASGVEISYEALARFGCERVVGERFGREGRTGRGHGRGAVSRVRIDEHDAARDAVGPGMKLTFLGTGTSFGVPVVGCDCDTCTSADPRDRRTRHGALVDLPGGRLLVDTPPELRLQLLAASVETIDAVWFTHTHADHVHGLDDVRVFTVRRGDMPAFVPAEYREAFEHHFRYIFDDSVRPPQGSSKPRVRLDTFEAGVPIEILGETFKPVSVPHGDCTVYGFRVGDLGYVTDAKELPPAATETLEGVEVLVLNGAVVRATARLSFQHRRGDRGRAPGRSHEDVPDAPDAQGASGRARRAPYRMECSRPTTGCRWR